MILSLNGIFQQMVELQTEQCKSFLLEFMILYVVIIYFEVN